jgi:hypothetical protein
MWHTEIGDRILQGAEAKVFAEGLLDLVDETYLNPENDYKLGIPIFDNLTYNQKISILLTIANGLFKKNVRIIELTALNEGAISSVFEHIRNGLMFEVEENMKPCWRVLVGEALIELGLEEIPPLESRESDEWDCCIDSLSDQILWDTDYLQDKILDDSPEVATEIKETCGINKDYFIDVTPDPNDKETEKQLKQLQRLCARFV